VKVKAFVLPGGDIVSCHADVFLKAGFSIEEVQRMSEVEWSPFWQSWIARWEPDWSGRPIAQSPLRSECLETERQIVEALVESFLIANPKPKLSNLKAMLTGMMERHG
jgi:hypothetical protein